MLKDSLILLCIFVLSTCYNYSLFSAENNSKIFFRDLELAKITPLISGVTCEKILRHNKVAVTLCTTVLKNKKFEFLHAYLCFEIQDNKKENQIKLFAIHFGGDGQSYIHNSGWPIIDDAPEVIRKVYRGKEKNDENNMIKSIDPIYKRHVIFIVEKKLVSQMLDEVYQDIDSKKKRKYSYVGYSLGGVKGVYNCCTFVDMILRKINIKTDFKWQNWFKTGTNLVKRCQEYVKKNPWEHFLAEDLYVFPANDKVLKIDSLAEKLFKTYQILHNKNEIAISLYVLRGAMLLGHEKARKKLESQIIRDEEESSSEIVKKTKIINKKPPAPVKYYNHGVRELRISLDEGLLHYLNFASYYEWCGVGHIWCGCQGMAG